MLTFKLLKVMAPVALCAAIFGCGDNSPETELVVEQELTPVGSQPTETFASQEFAQSIPEQIPGGQVNDIVVNGKSVYLATDAGLFVYDKTTDVSQALSSGESFQSLLTWGDAMYVGGDKLYSLRDGSLELLDANLSGRVTSLASHNDALIIGTDQALYKKTANELSLLLDGVAVSALTANPFGLWVGTYGDGLYLFDGTDFKKRFLKRGTTLFDNVNCLASDNGYVYLGTDGGMFIFDGGKWQHVTDSMGLPSNEVLAIDASDFTVYIGTVNGVAGWYNQTMTSLEETIGLKTVALSTWGRKLISGTDQGVFVRNGTLLTKIFPKTDSATNELATAIQ